MILVINAGSSSVKFAVFDTDLTLRLSGNADGIGSDTGRMRFGDDSAPATLPDHRAALDAVLVALETAGYPVTALHAAAHRVVHGGAGLTAPARITPEIRDRIAACIPLAPLHNPHNLAAIDAIAARAPGLPQYASFDTGFHATNPDVAVRYALPPRPETEGLRRYGFHGISFSSLVTALPRISGAPLPARVLACHLGNGVSLCAIRDGRSVATTMGYSPLDGLTMGTRAGTTDPSAALELAARMGVDAARHLLNHDSGLRGLSGVGSDMRTLEANDSPGAGFAIAHFCYWIRRQAGSMIAAMEGVEAIAFTGGIGENSAPVRKDILTGLTWTGLVPDLQANSGNLSQLHIDGSRVACWIVPAEEERHIAREAMRLRETE